jgi:hypothetical protein
MITCHCPAYSGWEGFMRPGQVRRPAMQNLILSFREEKRRITDRFHTYFLSALNRGSPVTGDIEVFGERVLLDNYVILKYKFAYILFFVTLQLDAQLIMKYDTIKIHEVVISGKQLSSVMPGFKNLEIRKGLWSRRDVNSVFQGNRRLTYPCIVEWDQH